MLITSAYAPPSLCPTSTFTVIAPSSPLKHSALIQTDKCLHSTHVHRAGRVSPSVPAHPQKIKKQIEETDSVFPQASHWLLQQRWRRLPVSLNDRTVWRGGGYVREVRRTDREEGSGRKSLGVLQSVCQRNSMATRAPTCVTLNSWSRHMISPPPKPPPPPHPVRLEIEDSCPGREARPAVTTCRPRQMIDSLLILSNRMRRVVVEERGAEETEWWWWW